MRNKKEFREEILVRYNREKRRREIRRKNLTSAVCSLCMMFVILLSGSVYLSAAFGASLFAEVDVDFDWLPSNKAEDTAPPADNESPEENMTQSKDEGFTPEEDGSKGSSGDASFSPETVLPGENETVGKDKSESTSEVPEPVETVPETTKNPLSTTKAPETTMAPEWVEPMPETTKKPSVTTKAPETTKAPQSTKAPESLRPMPETTKKPSVTTKVPEMTRVPESPPSFNGETDAPTAESGNDGADFWRAIIIGSAAICLTAACVFVFKAVKKGG